MGERKQPSVIWFNGELCKWDEAKVHVWTEVATRGTNVFEGIRSYKQANSAQCVLNLEEHIKRLFHSARIMHIPCNYSPEEIYNGITELVNIFKDDEFIYIRPTIYVESGRYWNLMNDEKSGAYIVAFPIHREEKVRRGITCCVSSWERSSELVLSPLIKIGAAYQTFRLPMIEAKTNGYEDAILLNKEGFVSETTGAAIFICIDGVFYTPPLSSGILNSITRRNVIQLINEKKQMPVKEVNIVRTQLYIADEIFIAGTLAEITPVIKVDSYLVNNGKVGKITKELQEEYFDRCSGRHADDFNWLTSI